MSAPSISRLSVELLLRVIDVKYGCFAFYFTLYQPNCHYFVGISFGYKIIYNGFQSRFNDLEENKIRN